MKEEITDNATQLENVLPVVGKDEMNLIEFPLGPVTQTTAKTMVVEHVVWDKCLRREVVRRLIVTGADAFGLPRPIDDQVLIGMKALTYEAGGKSREVRFSRYELCRAIGWEPDGRAYRRLEASFDRIAGTTLKFKDSWWDKGESEWKSHTVHLIESVNLCSRDELDRKRLKHGQARQKLCSFVWSEIVWKSFQDGFIKTLDMAMFRKIATGNRKEVPVRLYRILDKRFHHGRTTQLELERLCVGTLGLSPTYTPCEMLRVLTRASTWLIKCGFLESMSVPNRRLLRSSKVTFVKASKTQARRSQVRSMALALGLPQPFEDRLDDHALWLLSQDESKLSSAEKQALHLGFGSELERRLVQEARAAGKPVLESGRIRTEYVRKFLEASGSCKQEG